jgi:hypothetical protein
VDQSFFYLAAGVAVLLVALGLLTVFRRLNRALARLEELLITTNEEMRETLPEVRGSVGNVNDITAVINLGVHAAEQGIGRSGRRLRSGVHGIAVAARSLVPQRPGQQGHEDTVRLRSVKTERGDTVPAPSAQGGGKSEGV